MDFALVFGTIAFLVIMPMLVAVWAATFLKNNPPRDVLEAQQDAAEADTDETEAA